MWCVEVLLKRGLVGVDIVQEIAVLVREVLEDIEAQTTWLIPHRPKRRVPDGGKEVIPLIRVDRDRREDAEHVVPISNCALGRNYLPAPSPRWRTHHKKYDLADRWAVYRAAAP